MVNSKELKEKIVRELAVKNLADAESMLGVHRDDFTKEEFQEINHAIDENIKLNISEWRVEEIVTFNGYYGGAFYGEKKELMLLHQSAELGKYDREGFLNTDVRKMFRKEDYPIEQWVEIENALNNQKKTPPNHDKKQQDNYENWTREQFIAEINKLKTEIESLKTNQTLTSSEKQERIQKSQQKLEQLEKSYSTNTLNTNSNAKSNSSSTNLAIGGIVLAIVGLVSVLVFRKRKKIVLFSKKVV